MENLVRRLVNMAGVTRPTGLHKDHLGSVDAITNETGALAERLSYDAWGKRRQGNGLDATAPITGATTHHGYTGHEHLDGLGLIHMNARVYDPAIGRFLQADPIGFEGGLNLYGYAEGNPLRYSDPNGGSPLDVGFFLYDGYQFGKALYQGSGIGEASINLGLSLLGVISPIPGAGEALKGLRILGHTDGITKVVQATRIESIGENYYRVYHQELPSLGISAYLDRGRSGLMELDVSIRTKLQMADGTVLRAEGFSGKDAYLRMFSYFGDRVEAVRNTWIGDNLSQFNKLTAKGLSPEMAALQVWDGQRIMESGFSLKDIRLIGNPGDYSSVKTFWGR